MAFDRFNATHRAELRDEFLNDPALMGYTPDTNITQTLKLVNDPDSNTGSETANITLDAEVLMQVINWDDYASNPVGVGGRGLTDNLMRLALNGYDIEQFREALRAAYQPNSATIQALNALIRKLSRAEVRWGMNTFITREDWIYSRDNV